MRGSRDPDVWLARAAWAIVTLSLLQILLFGFGRDQGIYAVVGDSMLSGKMPYRDAWEAERVLGYIGERAGTEFDPEIAAGFIAMMRAYEGRIMA